MIGTSKDVYRTSKKGNKQDNPSITVEIYL